MGRADHDFAALNLDIALKAALAEGRLEALAYSVALAEGELLEELFHVARELRERGFGAGGRRRVTFSPKVFLPLTNLCRNRCDYCSFRKSWGQKGAETFEHETTVAWLDRGQAQGCVEALFCLGDTPETAFPEYAELLRSWGHHSTVDYLDWSGERALERGLLPHTNAGLLSERDILRLKRTNISQGLMLENSSERLCGPGMVHRDAPDKHPAKRLAMLEAAGRAKVPFTTGILLGIGETPAEVVESLLSIRRAHLRHGHIQEVIVQNFRARPKIPMRNAPEPEELEVARAVALARLILPPEVSVQAPPNLNPGATQRLLSAGLNDFGGISPLTPDYINPYHPWPHLRTLQAECAEAGFQLEPRLPVYPRYLEEAGFVEPALLPLARQIERRLAALEDPVALIPRENSESASTSASVNAGAELSGGAI